MSEVETLKGEVEKMKDHISKLEIEAGKTSKLEKELSETKSLLLSSKSKTIFVSKDRKLHKFSGRPTKEEDPTAEEWIEDVIQHLKCIEGNDAQVEFITDHLIGKAKDEVKIRPESERSTGPKILEIIRHAFQDAETVAQLQKRFYQRKQRTGESLQDYTLILLKLVNRMIKKDKTVLGNTDIMLRERFIDGVLDRHLHREMRIFVSEHPSISFFDFRDVVLRWMEDESEDDKSQSSSSEVVTTEEIKHKIAGNPIESENVKAEGGSNAGIVEILESQQKLLDLQQKQLDKLTKLVEGKQRWTKPGNRGNRGNSTSDTVCYNCNGQGHIARDCPSQRAARGGFRGRNFRGRGRGRAVNITQEENQAEYVEEHLKG